MLSVLNVFGYLTQMGLLKHSMALQRNDMLANHNVTVRNKPCWLFEKMVFIIFFNVSLKLKGRYRIIIRHMNVSLYHDTKDHY